MKSRCRPKHTSENLTATPRKSLLEEKEKKRMKKEERSVKRKSEEEKIPTPKQKKFKSAHSLQFNESVAKNRASMLCDSHEPDKDLARIAIASQEESPPRGVGSSLSPRGIAVTHPMALTNREIAVTHPMAINLIGESLRETAIQENRATCTNCGKRGYWYNNCSLQKGTKERWSGERLIHIEQDIGWRRQQGYQSQYHKEYNIRRGTGTHVLNVAREALGKHGDLQKKRQGSGKRERGYEETREQTVTSCHSYQRKQALGKLGIQEGVDFLYIEETGRKVECLLDTGSDLTLIRENILSNEIIAERNSDRTTELRGLATELLTSRERYTCVLGIITRTSTWNAT
ncbi:hypothetical protein PR048_020321 [Dryococelus australis]|uniref:Peptidase A2 domain-containing protein n=1 Tax=Dryococelus australis TaxID=614101 RepID=A0ABQ9H6C4_9NEOP|nr:hypothetical protein PR048_020321 [Dryococelus australis]